MPKNQYYTEAELKKIFTNLKRKGFTDVMANMLISHTYNRPVNTRTSGFYFPGGPDATLSWNNSTRTVSLTPVDPGEPVYTEKGDLYVPNFRFYVWNREARMQRKEEMETLQLPNEEGLFLIHFGVNQDTRRYELLYIKNPEIDEIALTYIQGVPVAWLYWAYDLQQALYFGDSRHGSEWNPQMHWMLHQTINSQRQSGLALTNVTYDGDGTSNGDYQFGISAGELWHDDIFAETDAVAEADSLPVWYFDGAGLPRFSTSAGKKFLNTGTGRVAHQSLTGGLAEAPDMSFVAYHLFATNCLLFPHISAMGQASHESLGAATGSIEAEIATLRQQLPHANMMHVGSFILQTSDDYTNDAKARVVWTSSNVDTFTTELDFDEITRILTLRQNNNKPDLEVEIPGGTPGQDGQDGEDGITPHIGVNGNWWIGETDTGIAAQGPPGTDGTNGADGSDGITPHIGVNGNWWIDTTDTGIPAQGPPGTDGQDGEDGAPGIGIPAGGTTGQVLKKKSDTDYDTEWGDDETGGGGGGSDAPELHLDFEEAGDEFVYNVPYSMKFTSMVCEGTDATLDIALNTTMARYDRLKVTATASGLVSLYGVYV